MADRLLFPPTTVADMRQRGWDAPDFVYVSGDAYVDHPSFGAAVIVRTLEAAGYHVAVLAQPNWKNANDFKRFGRPNYGFLVSSGVIDSMVNHYTAAKRRRSSDAIPPAARRPGGRIARSMLLPPDSRGLRRYSHRHRRRGSLAPPLRALRLLG